VKLVKFRKSKATCFLSDVEDRANVNISNIIYTWKYIQNMFPNVGLLEETRRKEGRND
jgi:hypothetical protein